MKKIHILLFLFAYAISSSLHAQEPSKAETIKYMNEMLQLGVGAQVEVMIVTQQDFSGDQFLSNLSGDTGSFSVQIPKIPWHRYDSVKEIVDLGNGQISINIKFKNNVKQVLQLKIKSGLENTKETYLDTIAFIIPKEKSEGFNKAIIRLSELYALDNQSPFDN
jgi:hypothetical protein